MNNTPTNDLYDIAIVGFGPSGATSANFALMQGLRVVVVERDLDVFPRQRAITADDEVLRIFQTIGLIEPIRANMHEGVTSVFVNRRGKRLMSLASAITHNGYHQRNFFHQPHLEGELRKGTQRFGDRLTTYFGYEAVSVVNETDTAAVTAKSVATGEEITLRAKYVLACDGGSSAIRKSFGIKLEGTSLPDPWFDVQAEVKSRMPEGPHLTFICDPERSGVDTAVPGGMHRFEWRMNPGETEAEMDARKWEIMTQLARSSTGDPTVQIDESMLDVKRTWQYTFHVRHSANWRVGRVFLLGDAAHLMPAFAGAGMAAAFRDTANLLWKIKAVLSGVATPDLLDTYQQERGPHVDAITKYAEKLGRIVETKNPRKAALRDVYYQVLGKIPGLKAYTTTMKGKPVPGFREGFVSTSGRKGTPVGRTFPNVQVGTADGPKLLDDVVGYNMAIFGLDVDPRSQLDADTVAEWERWGARFIRIRTATLQAGQDEVGDPAGRLWHWFKTHGATVAIVRPDHIVYTTDAEGTTMRPRFTAPAKPAQREPVKA